MLIWKVQADYGIGRTCLVFADSIDEALDGALDFWDRTKETSDVVRNNINSCVAMLTFDACNLNTVNRLADKMNKDL